MSATIFKFFKFFKNFLKKLEEINPFNGIIAGLLIIGLLIVGWDWSAARKSVKQRCFATAALSAIMSTPQFNMAVCAPTDHCAAEAVKRAEDAARIVEREMNIYNPASELFKFNAAKPGSIVNLSAETQTAIRLARKAFDETGGAFDATLRPVILLWKNAAKTNKLPAVAELAAARKSSSWSDFRFSDGQIGKMQQSACVDLGGIAKGFAIDLAVGAMKKAGCEGGLVDIGGDVGCFGHKNDGSEWVIGIRDPFEPHSGKMLATLHLTDAAVCTSGNYERAELICGRQYNHIIDPRTLQPADTCPSVTVIAPTAAMADAWATALSVLGPDGLKLLKKNGNIHAMLVVGKRNNFNIVTSPDFSRKFVTQIEGVLN
ncbi:MAG TPA: FAD:protein FMN transferase [Phycisphaerae bacterium]|nr:FAD:protein FMN transferase [Phycisphaerae bacterium]HPS52153.1 FAD:protein FMN transferase [Phycisphaerae bacterium]